MNAVSPVYLHKLLRNAQDYGWGKALRKTLGYMARPVGEHRVYRAYRIDPFAAPASESPAGADVTFKVRMAPR
jgi:hypothetical protein